ncbi:MAG TPA: putative lipid II flippase FtsW [Jatrophihabitans sp.]|jgi:cell division protein FtsW
MSAVGEFWSKARGVARAPGESRFGKFLEGPFASVQLLLAAGAGLLGFGVLMAVSTSIAAAHESDGVGTTTGIWTQIVKQAIFICLGLPIFWAALCLPPRAYRVLAYPMLGLALIALGAVLVPGIGVDINDSRRWLDIGPLQLQPSEFAKLALLLWGGDLLARKQQFGTLRRTRHLFIPLLPGFLVVAALVAKEPDLGTTCCLVLILLGLLWMVGMPLRYFALLLITLSAGVLAIARLMPARWERVTTFMHPFQDVQNTGFHTVEGLYALASGGFFGVGLGQGTSKYGWVPNANSDYVFAIIGEEMGLLGCVAVLALFGFFAYAGMRVSRRSPDPFVRLVAGAATVWIGGQAIINVGYVTGLLPVTGIPLPFISAGGTSLLVSFFVLGMLVSFARHEHAAVAQTRKAVRLGTRSRIERWCRVPVPQAYSPPKKKRTSAARAARVRPVQRTVVGSAKLTAAKAKAKANASASKATGTDG